MSDMDKIVKWIIQGKTPYWGGGGVLLYKSDGDARRKMSRTPLKGTRILFYGRVPNLFPPLRGTNSTTTNDIKPGSNVEFHMCRT